ncbi:hypothetical protein [Rosistilla oblonga]|uniref:hypothetical protein n=1 Tax=Rosistilla oblonga TaxID=2527990 RepID=UPI003A9739E6
MGNNKARQNRRRRQRQRNKSRRLSHSELPHLATVPLAWLDGEYPIVQDRTGLLLQIGGNYFVMTAAHDWPCEHDNPGSFEWFASTSDHFRHLPSDRGEESVPLHFKQAFFLDEKTLDVVLFELCKPTVQQLRKKKKFLSQRDLVAPISPAWKCEIYGFPLLLSDAGQAGQPHLPVLVQRLSIGCELADTTKHSDAPEYHMLLELPEKVLGTPVHSTTPVRLELDEFVGISGGGIWVRQAHASRRRLRLAGMFRAVNSLEPTAIGTRINHVINALAAQHDSISPM